LKPESCTGKLKGNVLMMEEGREVCDKTFGCIREVQMAKKTSKRGRKSEIQQENKARWEKPFARRWGTKTALKPTVKD